MSDRGKYLGNDLSDEVIYLCSSSKKYPERLRRVVVCDVVNHQTQVLLTNNFAFDPQTIGNLYKSRWQIECFFKMLKENFKIKTFNGWISRSHSRQSQRVFDRNLLFRTAGFQQEGCF